MSDEIKIQVVIAGRSYPLRIKQDEKSRIDTLVERINACYLELKNSYPLKDERDYLAMTLLQLGNDSFDATSASSKKDLKDKLDSIESLLDQMSS